MKVFATGALGFIGRSLLERYRQAGAQVAGVDREADGELGVVAGDILKPGAWSERMRDADVIFHTAAVVSNVGDADDFWRVNVLGTRRVIEAAAGSGRFVHLSSTAAFGFDLPPQASETHPVRPNGNHYVDTKIASEQVVLQAHAAGELECTIVRPADVYGPGSRPWTIVPVQMLRSRQFLLPASGRGVFSPVYIDNLVDGLVAAGETDAAAGQVFTVGDGVSLPARDFFGHYARMLGGAPIWTLPTPLAAGAGGLVGAGSRLVGKPSEASAQTMRMLARNGGYSIEKARRVLGYEPKVDLEEGMRRTERWLVDQGMIDAKQPASRDRRPG
ncbi:MAG: NAD-dependent epimerase/dehydratase family protein [Thermoleophilia bacterium]|nr:NAD-dependent epimerase/dehydratase family protein [Thermoleophilia bacterium]GIK77041.1 MAG: putative oxidoreductase [Actinomycetes bacterium]